MTIVPDDQMRADVQALRSTRAMDYPLLLEEEWDLAPWSWQDALQGVVLVGLPRQRQRGSWYYTASYVGTETPDQRPGARREWEGRTPPSAEDLAAAVERAQGALRKARAPGSPPLTVAEAIREVVGSLSVGQGALARWTRLRLAFAGIYSVGDEAIWAEASRMEEAGALVLSWRGGPPARSRQQLYSLAAGAA